MTEVIVDGVKYVPSDEAKMQVETMREVLESMGYLSTTAIEEIITKFEEFGKPQKKNIFEELLEEKKPQKSRSKKPKPHASTYWENKKFRFDCYSENPYLIDWVYPKGNVKLKSGRKAGWTIQDAVDIQKRYHEGLTYGEFNEIVDEVKPSRSTVARILSSLLHGDLKEWIEKWKRMNTPILNPPKKIPIQNNPEKRKELGYGGIP